MANERDALRVFISYARRDASAFAEELLQGLEVAGFEAFLDRHDIAAGEDWEARLGGFLRPRPICASVNICRRRSPFPTILPLFSRRADGRLGLPASMRRRKR